MRKYSTTGRKLMPIYYSLISVAAVVVVILAVIAYFWLSKSDNKPVAAPAPEIPNVSVDNAPDIKTLPPLPSLKSRVLFTPAMAQSLKNFAGSSNYKLFADSQGTSPCNYDNAILRNDLQNTSFDSQAKCEVMTGVLAQDPYSKATNLNYDRNDTTKNQVSVDYIVPWDDAWANRPASWNQNPDLIKQFANDPLNSVVVSKSAKDNRYAQPFSTLSKWKPETHQEQCMFAAKVDKIKTKYNLTYFPSEFDNLVGILKSCKPTDLTSS